MYIPNAFAETDTAKLFDFVQANSLVFFFTARGQPFATHVPFLLERSAESPGWLWGHLAKANPHWHDLAGDVLVVFPGPHTYISPAWYEDNNVVPTWNYVAVHVYGRFSLVTEPAQLLKIVEDSVNFYEAPRPTPWSLDGSHEYAQKILKGIVGFKIEITRLEGKCKLSQNHPAARQEKIIKALRQQPDPNSAEIAGLMAENLTRR
ncbi:MAG: FMN-binding negative transcriptional regulator [Anaerolineales bacterium]|nr:FMN-binding negative transcriptional regulator [Anaerolineales bacterium]